MRRILTVVCLIVISNVWAQNSITKEIERFSEIKAYDGISVNLVRASENKVHITGEDAGDVAIVVNGDKLKIRMEINKIFKGHKTFVEVFYTGPLEVIDVNENAYISSSDVIEQIDLEVRAQEAGEIDLELDVQRLKVKSVSGGIISVKGKVKNQEVDVNTGGEYDGEQAVTEQTSVVVKAGGQAGINASEYVEAKVKAGGTIKIYGNPKVIDQQKFMGGVITEM